MKGRHVDAPEEWDDLYTRITALKNMSFVDLAEILGKYQNQEYDPASDLNRSRRFVWRYGYLMGLLTDIPQGVTLKPLIEHEEVNPRLWCWRGFREGRDLRKRAEDAKDKNIN